MAGRKGFVYYARVNGYIKVGWTGQEVLARMDQYPPGTELLAVHPGTPAEESRIHGLLADHLAAKAEWFTETPEVMAFIADVVRQYGRPPEIPAPRPGRKKPPGNRVDGGVDRRPMIGRFVLYERGWSDGMIRDFLGWPDSVKGHELHRRYGNGMKLWLKSRVEAAEATPEFEERWRRLVDARLAKMEADVS